MHNKWQNKQNIVNHEGGLEIQNLHDQTHNSLYDDWFKKIIIYLMQGINKKPQ